MANKFKLNRTVSKGFGTLTKVFDLFDTVAMVDKVSKNTAPILEKAIDRHYDAKKDLMTLPDVRHLSLEKAREHLEELGFLVISIEAKPNQLDKFSKIDEVVAMVPKSGTVQRGSLIKLYYCKQSPLEQSQQGIHFNLSEVHGLMIDEAKIFLEDLGCHVALLPLTADRKYANQEANRVLTSEPKQQLFKTSANIISLVKLYYLTPETLKESQELERQYLNQKLEQRQALVNSVDGVKQLTQSSLLQAKKLSLETLDKAKDLLKKR